MTWALKTSDVIVHKMPLLEIIKVPTFRWTPILVISWVTWLCILGT